MDGSCIWVSEGSVGKTASQVSKVICKHLQDCIYVKEQCAENKREASKHATITTRGFAQGPWARERICTLR